MTGNGALAEVLELCPVVPVLVVGEPDEAVGLGRALVAGGLSVLEVTLRTPSALACIAAMADAIDGAVIGAGTVLTAAQLAEARDAGARFAVSPGSTPGLLAAAAQSSLPLLPGAATASESMRLLEAGYVFQKFFPAEASGGIPALKGIGGPLPQIRFCPTGGVTAANAAAYLALPNVVCIGGTWVASADQVRQRDWAAIEANAREAAKLAT
ncbi:MAG: bifunctional 4-hydroxy-2-oxoglutarate aldolase/2-dehydro-3-deoxy-phosphogluconate aldolase [Pseudomonadota bacterium]